MAGECEPSDRQRAALLALEMRSDLVLRSEDLEAVWYLLQRHAVAGPAGELAINYDDFSQVAAECRELVGSHTDAYFQASSFLRLARDGAGCVPLPSLFHYLAARSRQLQLRVELGQLDVLQSGALNVEQLQRFLLHLCPTAALEAAGVKPQDWTVVAAQRTWLAYGRRGRALIKDLVTSPLMIELLQTVQLLADAPSSAAGAAAPAAAAGGGWFAAANALRLRRGFDELDADGDGVLSAADFARFSEGTMTALFIQRLFSQHCRSSSGGGGSSDSGSRSSGGKSSSGSNASGARGMDFAAFAKFVAAWEDRGHPAAARYFFEVLDLQGQGYLSQVDLYTLLKEVVDLWVELGQYAELRVEDLAAEVTDMLRPADPRRITAADFVRSGAAATAVGLLADVNLLWEYENREALAQQAQQQEEGQ